MRILATVLVLALASPIASTAFAAESPRISGLQRSLIEAYARDQARTAEALALKQREAAKAAESSQGSKHPGSKGHGAKDKGGKDKGVKGLPPGIAKNLQRGKPLPPGIAKQRLPETLTKAMPPAPKGHEFAVVDGRVVLVDSRTQLVMDLVETVFLR
jgi:hypothetical protein